MANDYGAGVSRVLDPTFTQFLSVIWQSGQPPLDSEFNLAGDLAALSSQQQVLRGIPSGWLGNDANPSKVYVTDPTYSNWFEFGRQRSGDKQSIMWANVNGWLVPCSGTQTGNPPGAPNDLSTVNRILLDPPPSSAGDSRCDFVFLEVWMARIAPYPSTLNKPNASAIYKFGNTEGGFSYLPDDLMDPSIGEETTERVQLQYRIRVTKGLINLSTNPDGFDPSVVKSQAAQATPPSVGGYTFTNMREELGDNGLWRAGDGNPGNSLGTVDGYCYAIPIAAVFRRSSITWSGDPSPNLNGGFNRNPTAIDRTGTLTFSTVPTLAAPMTASTSPSYTISLVSATGIPLPVNPTPTAAMIQIGDEVLTYTTITGTTISGLTRGVNGTIPETHPAGTVINLLSSRPDGLFADQVTGTDILDLRHIVNPSGFDCQSLLQSNLDKLLRGQLRSTYKRSGTDPRGPYVFYEDKISATPPTILGITALDGPDNIRFAFSDAAIQQKVELVCTPITSGSFPISTQTLLFPVTWDLELSANTTYQLVSAVWSAGDQIQVPVNQFQTPSLPGSDADQVRILNEVPIASSSGYSYGTAQFTDSTVDFVGGLVYPGDLLVIYTPLTGGGANLLGGSYTITEVTSTVLTCSSTIPAPVIPGPVNYEIRRGVGSVQVRIEGTATLLPQNRFAVTPINPSPSDDLVIQLLGTDSLIPTSSSTSVSSQLHISLNIQYGGGRGISKRPDSIHNISLVSPSSEILVSQSNVIKPAWAALWSNFRNEPYKGLLPVTAGAFADLGSKTVVLCPFRSLAFPQALYLSASIMGTNPEGFLPFSFSPDPLGLFKHTAYITLPRHLIPSFGAVNSPILPPSSSGNVGDFGQGINFGLFSKVGTSDNSTYINYTSLTVTCAVFSTHNLTTLAPATYNAALVHGFTYSGSRFFNDDPTAVSALTTARGLGRQGVELPPYYGIARLWAVYEAADYAANGSAFLITTTRAPRTDGGGAQNLLRQNFDGPTFWIERDSAGVSTFILNADVIDLSKSTVNPIASFVVGKYVIEANIFGFDVGSFDLTQPFRLALSSAATLTGSPVPGPVAVLPGPLNLGNTALVNYSHVPYQGDPWQTQSSGLDSGYTRGPLDSPTAFQLASTSLNAAALTRPNQKSLEVLASMGFITSLGTGRLSGDFVTPNTYDPRNVGYEDPVDQSGVRPYPPTVASGGASTPRPITKLGAIGGSPIFTDLEANPEYLGLTTRLPLGALYRDKDFHGGRFSDQQSSPLIYVDKVGVGSGVAGLAVTETLDQLESPTMPAETSAGVAGDVLVMVDGESVTYSSLVNFRTNRGGSAFIGSGDHPGGELFATYEKVMGSVSGSRTVVGRAFLVRNTLTNVGSTEVSGGDELMLAIVTQVMELNTTPSEAMVLLGTNGSGEGLSAADLYRIEGHPLIANHTFYDVDPTTISLPVGKTIAQISAPPDVPVIPLGAASTVYASDGLRNFWTNIPTLTGLNLISDLDLGGNIVFTATNPFPNIYQADAAPGVNGTALQITNQKITPTASTGSGFAAAPLILSTAQVDSPTPGWMGSSGQIQIQTGGLDSSVVGHTGDLILGCGSNLGAGSGGSVHIGGGIAFNPGSGGEITLIAGNAFGTSGDAGRVLLSGGTVLNGSNPSGVAGDIILQGGHCGSIAGNGGNIHLNAGSGPTDGYVDVLLGLGVIRYAQFTNLNLILGPQSGAPSNYGLQFSALTTNPTIGQATGTGFGALLTIRAQAGGPGNNGGGNVNITSGLPTGSGSVGDILLVNGTLVSLRTSLVDSESAFFGTYVTEVGDGFFSHDYSLTFSSRATNPKIGQKPTNGPGETLIVKAADVSAVFTGKGGDLQLEGGNGISGDGGDIVLVPGLGPGGNPGRVIGGKDVGSGSGRNLSIISQTTTDSGFSGGDLQLIGGDGGFTGGSVWIIGGVASAGTGGDIILNTGSGSSTKGQAFMRVAGFDCLTLTESGPRVRAGSGPFGLHFDASNPGPTTIGDGCLFVNIGKSLIYQTVPTDVRVLEGTIARIVDTSTFTGSPVTSSSPTALISAFPSFSGVVDGDIIEGTAFVHITAAQSVGQVATFYLIVKDGSTLDIATCTISLSAATGIDQTITVPFSYTASGTSGIVEFRPEAASSDGTTPVTVSKPNSNGKWLFAKHTRP